MDNIIETFWNSDYKSIYDALQDDISKRIFRSRVLYSATGDERFLLDSFRCISVENEKDSLFATAFCGFNEMYIKVEEESINHLNSAIHSGKKIVLCGARGTNANRLKKRLICTDRVVMADNNADGVEYFKYSAVIESCRDALWIIPCNDYKEIRDELLEGGIEWSNIIVLRMKEGVYWTLELINSIWGEDYCRDYIFKQHDRKEYFDKSIMCPSNSEVFVDCGFYDGKNSREFIEWCGGDYKRIIAFEADERLYKEYFLGQEIERLELHNTACWSESGKVNFKKTSDVTELGHVDDSDAEGSESIITETIDDVLNGKEATFIKMDIEGSEYNALRGAYKTITGFKPKLAISVYHKPEDIIRILIQIQKMNSEYKFYLRTYEYTQAGVVLYAI